jgi:hypothetical protein
MPWNRTFSASESQSFGSEQKDFGKNRPEFRACVLVYRRKEMTTTLTAAGALRPWLCVLLAALALVFTACTGTYTDQGGGTGDGENSDPKILVIQNIPANVYSYAQSGGGIGLFPVGTTPAEAIIMQDYVPGADLFNSDIIVSGSGPYTMTFPLYSGTNLRWTGSGTFDIYVMLNGNGGHYYRATSVSITSETTTIPFSMATEIGY